MSRRYLSGFLIECEPRRLDAGLAIAVLRKQIDEARSRGVDPLPYEIAATVQPERPLIWLQLLVGDVHMSTEEASWDFIYTQGDTAKSLAANLQARVWRIRCAYIHGELVEEIDGVLFDAEKTKRVLVPVVRGEKPHRDIDALARTLNVQTDSLGELFRATSTARYALDGGDLQAFERALMM